MSFSTAFLQVMILNLNGISQVYWSIKCTYFLLLRVSPNLFHSLSACSSVSCLNVHLSVLETIFRSAHIFVWFACLLGLQLLLWHLFVCLFLPCVPFISCPNNSPILPFITPTFLSLCYPVCFCDQCSILARLLDQAFSHIGHPSSGEHYELVSILHHICSESQEDTQVLYLEFYHSWFTEILVLSAAIGIMTIYVNTSFLFSVFSYRQQEHMQGKM